MNRTFISRTVFFLITCKCGKGLSHLPVQVYNKVSGFCRLTAERWISHSNINHADMWMLYTQSTVPPFSSGMWDRCCCVLCSGTEWHFYLNSPFYLHLHCVSRATAFPFSRWQYPSFLFISRLSGRRKWITGLSRRGTGAITGVWEKRNFDMWGLLILYSLRTLGICYGTSHC